MIYHSLNLVTNTKLRIGAHYAMGYVLAEWRWLMLPTLSLLIHCIGVCRLIILYISSNLI